jgi:2',3'-cyclic-nucleotide 2'-phosphodiesterase / 3'-nucleotidase / 5'-nucleotidase
LSILNPTSPVKVGMVDMSPYGAVVNSVAFHNGLVAVAVEANPKTSPGVVVLLDSSLAVLNVIPAGALPDMVTFSPDGRWLLCANEGEPNTYNDFGSETNGPSIDPEGSITVIDLSTGVAMPTVRTATFTAFNSGVPSGVRIFGPNATVAQDLEPEYLAVSEDSSTAWVTLQENNALAVVDIGSATVTSLIPLGAKIIVFLDSDLMRAIRTELSTFSPGRSLACSSRTASLRIALKDKRTS